MRPTEKADFPRKTIPRRFRIPESDPNPLSPKKKNDAVRPSFLSVLRLNRHDFFFFFGADVVDLFAILIGYFLHFLFEAFPLIFRQFLILF